MSKLKRNKIVIIQRVITKYRKPIFYRLKQFYDIEIIYSKLYNISIGEVEALCGQKILSFQYSNNSTNSFLFVFSKISAIKPSVIIHENSIGILSLPLVMIYCRLMGIKFILWGHGYNRFKGFSPKTSILDKIRLLYMKKSDAVLFYGQEGKKMISKYIDSTKLFVAPNTLDTEALLRIKSELMFEGKENIKKRLGITFKYNIIYIGRLLKSKSPEKLIQLFKYFEPDIQQNIGIHYIGDGEMMDELKQASTEISCKNNIVFHGAIFDDKQTGEYLFSSDLMIQPGYLGLSVNHAFCFDCPVVSFESKTHSPEIEYLIPNLTGYLAKMDDYEEMAAWVVKYLTDKEMQNNIKNQIKSTVQNICSINKMVEGVHNVIEYVCNLP